MTPIAILSVVVGLALVFFGRRLFWLFVGGVGFAAGMALAANLFQRESEWLVLGIALLAGIIGAVLTVLLQRLAIGLAGFFAGGYGLLHLATSLGRPEWSWIAFVAGGVIGAVLVLVLFDWALIGLSALTGAVLVVESVPLGGAVAVLVFAVLFVAGLAAQASRLSRSRASPPPVERRR